MHTIVKAKKRKFLVDLAFLALLTLASIIALTLVTRQDAALSTTPAPQPAPRQAHAAPNLPAPPPAAPAQHLPVVGAGAPRAAIPEEADGYTFTTNANNGAATAPNGRHGFSSHISANNGGLRLQPMDPAQSWYLEMGATDLAGQTRVRAGGPITTLERPGSEEWFYNDARGLEHGITLLKQPATRANAGSVAVKYALNTPLTPRLDVNARGLAFLDERDQTVLRYEGLVAKDSTGKALPARMELDERGTELALIVDDTAASYPLFIDPVFSTNINTLRGNPRVTGEHYGAVVSLSGDHLAIGIPHANGPEVGQTDIGAVILYRFVSSLQSWQLVKRVYAGDTWIGMHFGSAVALDADLLLVGAPDDANGSPADGSAYLFRRDEGGADNWGQIRKFTAPVPQNLARFGHSVGLNGGLAAFGEPLRSNPGADDQGAAYISARLADGTWGPVQALTTFIPVTDDNMGYHVEVSGNRVAVSAPYGETIPPVDTGVIVIHEVEVDAAGLLVAAPAQVLRDFDPTTDDRFGEDFALVGDQLLTGSPGKNTPAGVNAGAATLFVRDPDFGYVLTTVLQAPDADDLDEFGYNVALSGDTAIIGAIYFDAGTLAGGSVVDAGAVYTFERNAGGTDAWGMVEQLLPPAPEANAQFGMAVAASGDLFVVGTPLDDAPIIGPDAGEVFTYSRRSEAWRAVSTLLSPGTEGEAPHRGRAVAIESGFAAVGMPNLAFAGAERGAVRVLRLNQNGETAWDSDAPLVLSPEVQPDELFGQSVAINDNWLLVGAPGYDRPDAVNTGRAYLYRRGAAGWILHTTFEPPILVANSEFGASVALTDRWALIGAPGLNHAFFYDREEGGPDNWDITTFYSGMSLGGRFGTSVSLEGNVAAVGAPLRDGVAAPGELPAYIQDAGQVVLFRAEEDGGVVVWAPFKSLPEPAPDGSWGTLNAHFGASVALKEGVLAVGEPGYASETGRAWSFAINEGGAENWGVKQTLEAPAGQPGERMGASVAVNSTSIFVGAPERVISGVTQGAVLRYDRAKLDLPTPAPDSVLLHPHATEGHTFGASVAVSGDKFIAGAPDAMSSRGYPGEGGYAIFHQQTFAWARLGSPLGFQAVAGDQLGFAVAADGEFFVAGAPFDTVSGMASAGSAYLYRRSATDPSGWSFLKVLTANDVEIGAQYGTAVSLHGEVLAIGAPGWNGHGAVYVYYRNLGGADNWGLARKVFNASAGDRFGEAVAVHEELLAVGSPDRNNGATVDAGGVVVFSRHEGSTDNWGYQDHFFAPAPSAFAYFGSAISISNHQILVGEPLADINGSASGAAHLFWRPVDLNTWALKHTLEPADAAANDRFGTSVALEGPLAAVGAPGESTYAVASGAAYVFESVNGDGAAWTQRQRLVIGRSEPVASHPSLNFGQSVALRGGQLVISAPGADQGAVVNAGAAYLYERNSAYAEGWGFSSKLTAASPTAGDAMGASVAVTHDLVVVGAPDADQGGQADAGYVHIFGQISSAYASWAREQFGNAAVDNELQEATVWGQHADPDGDGLSNAIEAYMNTDPNINTSALAGNYARALHTPDRGIAMIYRAGKEQNGAVAQVKWSRDLDTWHRGEFNDVDDFVITTRVLEDHPDHFLMEALVSADQLVDEDTLYLRLEVNLP